MGRACLATRLSACLIATIIIAPPSAFAQAASSADGCVPDVKKAIGTQPTPAMKTAALPADLVARLDAAAQASFKEASTPGAIVGVRTPRGTWTAAYGKADPASGAPMQVGMHTRVGSLTKTFIGTCSCSLLKPANCRWTTPSTNMFQACRTATGSASASSPT
jgi:D-alanyl-D-alanine carboxypeptidase